jgi:FixJ family two-component response regulator
MRSCAQTRARTIAIVDDDPAMQAAISDLLNAHGFRTRLFSSAEEWLGCGAAMHTDCMILDVHLGGISGLELQARLRAAGSALPLIFITARDDETTRAQVLAAGGIVCLSKPFPATQLMAAIDRAAP